MKGSYLIYFAFFFPSLLNPGPQTFFKLDLFMELNPANLPALSVKRSRDDQREAAVHTQQVSRVSTQTVSRSRS